MSKILLWKGHSYLALPARIYLALVFLFACYHKILNPGSFALDIATYQILPLSLINIMAIVLPWIELVAGAMLLVGFRTRASALLIFGMMLMFTVAISIGVARGQNMSCGCFASQGAAEDPISWRTIARDSGWMLLSLYVFVFDHNPFGLDRWLNRPKALRRDKTEKEMSLS
jgi:putative oxidoreductase